MDAPGFVTVNLKRALFFNLIRAKCVFVTRLRYSDRSKSG